MIKVWLLFLLFSIPAFLSSQTENLQGEWTKRKLGTFNLGFILSDSTNVYSLNDRNLGSPSVSVFNKKTLLHQFDFQIKTDPSKESLTHIFSLQNSIFSVVEKKSPTGQLFIFLNRLDLGGKNKSSICIDTLPDKDLKDAYEIIVNENEDAFVYIKQGSVKAQNNQKLTLKSYDASLREMWNKRITFQDKEKHYILTDWSFSGKTMVNFIGRAIMDVYKPESEYSATNQNVHFLFNYNSQVDKFRELELSLNHKFIDKVAFKQGASKLIVTGLFADNKKFKTDGVFTLVLDDKFNMTHHALHHFTPKELKSFSNSRLQDDVKRSNSKRNYVNEMLIHDILLLENGESVFLVEEFRKEWEDPLNTVKQEVLKPSSFLYYYQNIHAIWIDKNGNIKNVKSIPKKQLSRDVFSKYNSFQSAHYNNKVYLFFNQNPKNLERPEAMHLPVATNKKMFVQSIQIQSDNAIVKKRITQTSKKIKVSVRQGAQLDHMNLYLYSQKGMSKKAIIKIDLAE